jgi:FRG domain
LPAGVAMPDKIIADYLVLREKINSLPKPQSGMIRVFRGQTEKHSLTPAGLRRRLIRKTIWSLISRQIMADISQQGISEEIDEAELRARFIWLEAIAQHYGLGSSFLDVTPNVDIALWFALNKGSEVIKYGVIGPTGPIDPTRDFTSEIVWCQYQPVQKGYLYVLDVPKWDEKSVKLTPGLLIELNKAPKEFSSSPRIRSQSACLLAATDDVKDLSKFIVANEPIEVARPLAGASDIDKLAEALFPPPSMDEWYERFLSIPLQFDTDSKTGKVVLRRAFPVARYVGSEKYMKEIMWTETLIDPAFVHDWMGGQSTGAGSEWWRNTDAMQATSIVLEAPFSYASPAVDSDLWNHGLLASDLSDHIEAYNPLSKKPIGNVSMTNVLIQFETLETEQWKTISAGKTHEMLRAVWLLRKDSEFVVHLVVQIFPGSRQIVLAGPTIVRIDPAKNLFVYALPHDLTTWNEISTLPPVAKLLFMSLQVLRALSPISKPEPSPLAVFKLAGGTNHYVITVAKAAAQLIHMRDPRGKRDWYVVRDPYNDEPFTHVSEGGTWEIESDLPYGKLNSDKMRAAARMLLP